MRILIATSAPLALESGAGQMAMGAAKALKERGHEVVLWTSFHSNQPRYFLGTLKKRARLNQFLETQQAFDIIDIDSELANKKTQKMAGKLVIRSTQPIILYAIYGYTTNNADNLLKKIARFLIHCFTTFLHTSLLALGWRQANYILCLGSLELEWMQKYFPFWKNKLLCYFAGTPAEERATFSNLRQQRKNTMKKDGTRFLWVGRWVQHKGIDILLKFIRGRIASYPKDSLTIVGCGSDANRDCPKELLESKRLKIIPGFNRKELHSLLAEHDVGLFTSKTEGWGLCLNEMLESGMPVFATHAGGVPDLQPYFKGALKPFPPPPTLTADTVPGVNFNDDYYKTFNWERLAEIYEQLK